MTPHNSVLRIWISNSHWMNKHMQHLKKDQQLAFFLKMFSEGLFIQEDPLWARCIFRTQKFPGTYWNQTIIMPLYGLRNRSYCMYKVFNFPYSPHSNFFRLVCWKSIKTNAFGLILLRPPPTPTTSASDGTNLAGAKIKAKIAKYFGLKNFAWQKIKAKKWQLGKKNSQPPTELEAATKDQRRDFLVKSATLVWFKMKWQNSCLV